MNPLLLLVCLTLAALQLGVPRRWAFIPLIVAACHTPYTPFMGGMTVARVVILIGLLRAGGSGWLAWSPRNRLDLLVAVFAGVALISTVGHEWEPYNPLVVRLRLVLDAVGTYLYMRAYLPGRESIERLAAGLAVTLIPFALLLLVEKGAGTNPYTLIGAQREFSQYRDGGFRAQGPFGTPILAGTVGGISIPLLLPLLRVRRRLALCGLAAAAAVIYASASSGPISTAFLGLMGVAFWRWRIYLKPTVIGTCILLVILHFLKERPIWYLMALMDLVGGSTGWHRAYLIDMAVKHFGEWWLIGTGYTRHWMPYGLAGVPEHCDLTNYYIRLGVNSGLGLVITLLAIQWQSFRMLGKGIGELRERGDREGEFVLWCVGATFFAHAITFLSISYFDQMYVFFWGLLGGLSGFLTHPADTRQPAESETPPRPAPPLEWGRGLAHPARLAEQGVADRNN